MLLSTDLEVHVCLVKLSIDYLSLYFECRRIRYMTERLAASEASDIVRNHLHDLTDRGVAESGNVWSQDEVLELQDRIRRIGRLLPEYVHCSSRDPRRRPIVQGLAQRIVVDQCRT